MAKAAQDGPCPSTGPISEDPFAYVDTSGEAYGYLGHFRKESFVAEGHNRSDAVGKKIGYLIHEGKKPAQAAAIAYSMKRAGRLSPSGHYRRVGR